VDGPAGDRAAGMRALVGFQSMTLDGRRRVGGAMVYSSMG
jgi:hypothetical protein